jgi:hypothetical protein
LRALRGGRGAGVGPGHPLPHGRGSLEPERNPLPDGRGSLEQERKPLPHGQGSLKQERNPLPCGRGSLGEDARLGEPGHRMECRAGRGGDAQEVPSRDRPPGTQRTCP